MAVHPSEVELNFNAVLDDAQTQFLKVKTAANRLTQLNEAPFYPELAVELGINLLDPYQLTDEIDAASELFSEEHQKTIALHNALTSEFRGRTVQLIPMAGNIIRFAGGKYKFREVIAEIDSFDLLFHLKRFYFAGTANYGLLRIPRTVSVRPFHENDPKRYLIAHLLD